MVYIMLVPRIGFGSRPGPLGGNFVLKFLIFYYIKTKTGPLAHFFLDPGDKYGETPLEHTSAIFVNLIPNFQNTQSVF